MSLHFHDSTTVLRHVLPGDGPDIVYEAPSDVVGPPLVLLHGLSANATSWAPVIDRFGDQWAAHALDFRGHGRSARTPGRYRLDDYLTDVDRLLQLIGEPSIVVGHSLGAVAAAALAQDEHPLVAGVFLEDPPLYLVEPNAFANSSFAPGFTVLREHIERLQTEGAPVQTYRDLLAGSPHPAGDRLGDHLHDDALWSRAEALAQVDPEAITAVLDGTTFGTFRADRPLRCPVTVVRADAAYDPGFLPEHTDRLLRSSPHVAVVAMPGAGHNVRGDRASRRYYLDVLEGFLSDHAIRS
jgi:pimeloyl-ACP methyl ester carboxylesterase